MVGLTGHITGTVLPGGVAPPPASNAGFSCCYGPTGILTIGATALNTPAWDIPNLARLWAEGAVRGENRKLPTVAGVRGYPTRLDETPFDLKLFITGDCDELGATFGDPWIGLEANIDTLRAGVFDPVTSGRGTRTGSLTMPDGTTRVAQVQVGPLKLASDVDDPSFVEASFELMVVSGRFQ